MPRILPLAVLLAGCCDLGGPDTTDTTDTTDTVTDTTDTGGTTTTPRNPDRGDGAGALTDADEQRDAFDALDPVEPWNPNLLAVAPGTRPDMPEMDDLNPTRVSPLRLSVADLAPTPGRYPWNGYLGRRAASDLVQTAYNSNWPIPDGRIACIEPLIMADCCSYTLTEGEDGSGDTTTYYKPLDMFATEGDAAAALREVYAQRPIYLPFTNGDVKLYHGWIYDWDDAHGSLDYGKVTTEGDDPTFRVRAVAPGTVVAKYWDDWHGNVLVIEHPPAPGGSFTYRSHYFHLRNGKDNDLNLAQTRTSPSTDPESSRAKYLLAANKQNPSDRFWGTNSQTIPVDVGDSVYAQQFVAWSGNTGPGGAGGGLDTNGDPTSTVHFNNHLHFMLSVKHPDWTGDEWLYVDPYGVYEQEENGCYDLVDNTEYDRLFAPFYPYCHGVDLGVFNFYLYYYGQMGRSPATFSVQQTGSGAIAAGAFKPGLSPAWYVYDYLEGDDFQDRWDELIGADFRLTERSATLDTQGVPRHNGVFRPDTIDDWATMRGVPFANDAWQDTFDDMTGQGFELSDFFAYHDGGTDLAAAIFEKPATPFAHHAGLTSNEFKTLTNDLADSGWLPVDVNVMELAGSTQLSAIYEQTGDARMVHWGMSPAEYQQWTKFYLSQGWDLMVVQNYADGTRYAAIYAD